MAFDNRDSIDFGKEDIHELFNRIFIPTLLGMMFNLAFIITDGIFVGHGVGPDGLAAVNLVSPVMMAITGLGMMFGTGSSVVAAIQLAKGKEKAARINVTQAFIASIGIALALTTVLYSCPVTVLRLLGTSEEIIPMAKEYLYWFIPTCLLIMIQIVGEFVIRLDGSPKYAMFANIIPAILNIILDYTFIFVCHWGLMGAAFATTIGTGVGASMTLFYMLRKADKLRFYRLKRSITSLKLGLRNTAYMIKVGFPGFLGEFAMSVMTLCGNLAFGRMLGDSGIAAFSVICYICPVVFNVYYAVSASAQPIISFNHGAAKEDRVNSTFRYSVGISTVFAAVITFVFWIAAPAIIGVFLKQGSDAFSIAASGLPLFSLGFVFCAFNISAIGFFQGIDRSVISIVLMSLRGIVLLIASFLVLPSLFGKTGLWLAIPATECVTAAVSLAVYIRFRGDAGR